MGLDISQLFGNAIEDAKKGMTDIAKIGGSAALGYLEDQAVKIIQADKQQHEANFKEGVLEVLNRPTAVDSLGNYISNAVQSPVIKQYGPYIILGVLLILGGGILISRGK